MVGGPWSIRLVLGGLVVGLAWQSARRASSHRIELAEQAPDRLNGASGQLSIESESSWYVAVALSLPNGRRKRALLFRDEFEQRDFRHLRARLRNR